MRNLSMFLLSAILLLLLSCDKQSTETEPIDKPAEETLYWISFKVTCWKNNEYNPVFCSVEIFKNEQSLEKGSTYIQDGWYASFSPYYRASDNARIILRDVPSGDIISEVFNITPISDPKWFVDSAEKKKTNDPGLGGLGHIHIGLCN